MGRHIRHKKSYWRELKLVRETEEKMLALVTGAVQPLIDFDPKPGVKPRLLTIERPQKWP